MREFDFEKFKRDNRRNLIILDKVFEIMKPIFKVTNTVEISVSEDGHPQLRYTHCPTKRAAERRKAAAQKNSVNKNLVGGRAAR